MRAIVVLALVACASLAQAQGTAKKELVAKLLQLQRSSIEELARSIVERPAVKLMQAAAGTLQTQVPADKREALAKSVDADIRKYIEEATPLLADRAVKIAPEAYGALIEQKFSEDELRQLIAWLESPVNRKFQQQLPEMQDAFTQRLVTEAGPLLDGKVQALNRKVQATLGVPAAPASTAPKTNAKPPAPAAKPASK